MRTIGLDLRYALRGLRLAPGFTVVAVATIALGVGANTAVFSVVDAVLLRPLPFGSPDRLAVLWETDPDRGRKRVSPPTLIDWQEGQRTLSGIAGLTEEKWVVTGDAEPQVLSGAGVTPDFFRVLDVRMIAGRDFEESDDVVGAEPVALVSSGFAMSRFGSVAAALDRTVRLDGSPVRVVGVVPSEASYPAHADVWRPLTSSIGGGGMRARAAHILIAVGRLRPGVTLEQATADLARISAGISEYDGESAELQSLHSWVSGDVKTALLVLLGAVGFVLLMACANVGNLFLVRATGRTREVALRSALGASRARLVRQFLVESMTLGALGGAVGTALSVWGVRLIAALSPTELPRRAEIGVSGPMLLFAAGVTLLTGVLVGLASALSGTRLDFTGALKEHGPASGAMRSNRVRSALIVAEVALSVVLLAGAGLMVRSFLTITAIDPGFEAAQATAFRISLPAWRYPEPTSQTAFFNQLLERVRRMPGVTSAALSSNMQMGGSTMTTPAKIEGRELEGALASLSVQVSSVSPDYFKAMGIRLLEGRTFSGADRNGSALVAVVDSEFAYRFFPDGRAVGKRARTSFGDPVMKEIVGVVASTRHRSLTADAPPYFYTPMAQSEWGFAWVVVRSTGGSAGLIEAVRAAVRDIDPEQPIQQVATLSDLLARSFARPRFQAELLGGFAAAALLLAALGFYAVIANATEQRRHEIGVRLALGAGRRDVLRLTIGQAMALTAFGLAVGIPGALLAVRVLTSLLFRITPTDPTTFVAVALTLVAVAALASWLPARRALGTDPVRALRE